MPMYSRELKDKKAKVQSCSSEYRWLQKSSLFVFRKSYSPSIRHSASAWSSHPRPPPRKYSKWRCVGESSVMILTVFYRLMDDWCRCFRTNLYAAAYTGLFWIFPGGDGTASVWTLWIISFCLKRKMNGR